MNETRDAEIHHLIGGELCLDFANTLYGHADAPIHEYLFDYRDLVLWSRHTGVLTDREVRGLFRLAKERPDKAGTIFRRAIATRETIYRIFAGLAQGHTPKADDLTALHSAWLDAMTHSSLFETSDGFHLDWAGGSSLERVLWPITNSAIQLLTSDGLQRIKQCHGCDWLFVDRSRNHMRRWCSMDACGNRTKMRRRHARRKLASR